MALDYSQAMVTSPATPADWLVAAPIAITLVSSAILLMVRGRVTWQPPVAIASLAFLVLAAALLLARVLREGPVSMTMGGWLPPFGISFVADAFGATMTLVASIAALAVAVYAMRDIPIGLRPYGFYPCLVLMIAGVCGAFLTGDIFNLYVWFEVLLIASFGMIVLGNSRQQLDGAVRYALLNFFATTLFLVAVGYLYGLLGTLNMADIAGRIEGMEDPAPLGTIAALFILAFGMKAAAFPVNFWLPASYHTPASAVAALFAGLLTKVGVYALMRTVIMLMPAQRDFYSELLVWIAVATMAVGAFGALAHSDLRRVLGYMVINGIGAMLAGVALASQVGLAGTVFYAAHSMFVMAALYMAVGIAGRLAGTFELPRLGGLYASQPFLAALMLVLVLAAAGLPPFSGFWPKVIITQAAFADQRWVLGAAVLASGFLLTIAGGRAFAQAFWRGGPVDLAEREGPAAVARLPAPTARDSAAMVGPVAALTLIIVALGLWPVPLLYVSDLSALILIDPASYIHAVFGATP